MMSAADPATLAGPIPARGFSRARPAPAPGPRTSARITPELRQLIEGLALRKPPPTVALVYRQVRDVAQRHGWPVPNYHRVYRIIKQLDPALLTLAHEGSQTYRTTYDLLYRHEAKKANDIWQADHTLLDIWVRSDNGPLVRPWLTVIMDDYSRAIAGFRLSLEAPRPSKRPWRCARPFGVRLCHTGSQRDSGDVLYRPWQ